MSLSLGSSDVPLRLDSRYTFWQKYHGTDASHRVLWSGADFHVPFTAHVHFHHLSESVCQTSLNTIPLFPL